jgi:hypothetical protein
VVAVGFVVVVEVGVGVKIRETTMKSRTEKWHPSLKVTGDIEKMPYPHLLSLLQVSAVMHMVDAIDDHRSTIEELYNRTKPNMGPG